MRFEVQAKKVSAYLKKPSVKGRAPRLFCPAAHSGLTRSARCTKEVTVDESQGPT